MHRAALDDAKAARLQFVTTLPAKAWSFSGYARRNQLRYRLTAPSGPILSSSRGLGRSDFYAWDDFPRQPLSELLRCAASGKPPGLQALCSLTPDRIDIYSSTDELSLKGVKRIPHVQNLFQRVEHGVAGAQNDLDTNKCSNLC